MPFRKQPRSNFNRFSTAEEVTEDICLEGKTVLITGVNSGLGFESMRVLSKRGAHIIALARSKEKAENSCALVDGKTTPLACELSDLSSVAACADTVNSMGISIDVVMCNAGIMAPAVLHKKQGLELQFLTNHLGHFVLVNKLLDRVKQADSGRIVMLSSVAHRLAPISGIDFDNLNGNHGYNPWRCYGRSKLANLLVANELSRRLVGSNATANAVHPGLIATNLSRGTAGLVSKFMLSASTPMERSIAQGAATQCYVAAHGNLDGISGSYFANCNPARSSAKAKNIALAKKLWEVSEDLAKDYW